MHRHMGRIAMAAALAMAIVPLSAAQGEKAPDDMTGIEVGEKAPDFTLKDQNGNDTALSDLLEDNKSVALVFYRSANW